MKKELMMIVIIAVILAVGLSGYIYEKSINDDKEKEKILDKFDGYQWNWSCFNIVEINFTLWKEHITKIEKRENYWLIEGPSSDRNDLAKNISSDESGKILIIYDASHDKITDSLHGGEIPPSPEIDKEGKITNPTSLVYC
jgi:hypothetical protein